MIETGNELVTVRISIVNYDSYNPLRSENAPETLRKRSEHELVARTNNKENKEKKEKKGPPLLPPPPLKDDMTTTAKISTKSLDNAKKPVYLMSEGKRSIAVRECEAPGRRSLLPKSSRS